MARAAGKASQAKRVGDEDYKKRQSEKMKAIWAKRKEERNVRLKPMVE